MSSEGRTSSRSRRFHCVGAYCDVTFFSHMIYVTVTAPCESLHARSLTVSATCSIPTIEMAAVASSSSQHHVDNLVLRLRRRYVLSVRYASSARAFV